MANEEQKEHWNSDEASHWVAHQLRYDTMLAPFGDRFLAAARVSGPDRVLDVGCGCGATTVESGRRAASGSATGLDLSTSMLDVGRRRATEERLTNVSFVAGDAQTYPFPDGRFDVVISRFGLMFFDDPKAAFTNMAGALASGDRWAFVCWQDLVSNPFVAVTGFATLDEEILLGGSGTLDERVEFLRDGGMGRAVLAGADEATQDRAVTAVRDALAPYVTDEGVRIGTA